jgi:hypothetical protein
MFFAVPFAAMAGCGNNGQNAAKKKDNAIQNAAKDTTDIKILAIIKQINPTVVPNALNASTLDIKHPPAGATVDGSIEIMPYTEQNLKVGDWVMIRQVLPTGASIAYPATIFGQRNINGKAYLEVWPAETPIQPANSKNTPIPVGKKIFVLLSNFVPSPAPGVAAS